MFEKLRGTKEQAINEGISEHEDNLTATQAKQVNTVSASESIQHFNEGIEAVKELIGKLEGKFIGIKTPYGRDSENRKVVAWQVELLKEKAEEEVLKKLTGETIWSPLYDDDLVPVTYSAQGRHLVFLGDQNIGKFTHSYSWQKEKYDKEASSIFGKSVTFEDCAEFEKEVKAMLEQSYAERGVASPDARELPAEIKEKIEKLKHTS